MFVVDIMFNEEIDRKTLEEYKALEVELHRDLMKSCRKYINYLDIVSIVGIIDIVKQEAIELERATRKNISSETPGDEGENIDNIIPQE